jgi:putative metallopeptidase DUF4344
MTRSSRELAWLVAAAAVLLPAASAGRAAPPAKASTSFPIEYVPPKQAAYQRLYDGMRERRLLERLSEALAFIRLPTPLTLRTAECGESNAMYDEEEHTATFCYEYVEELIRNTAEAEQHGFTREEAVLGPFVFIYLHEVGHALFDLLKVPILGHEEDAADQVATFILLRAGPELAKRTLATTALMYLSGAKAHTADESDFSDVHALDAQRYYNVLCLAYGSDPQEYAAAAAENRLPADRAESCEGEYAQVAFAARTLLARHVDAKAFRRTVERAKARRARDATQDGK